MDARSNESYECSRQTFGLRNHDLELENVVTPWSGHLPRSVMQAKPPLLEEEHSPQLFPSCTMCRDTLSRVYISLLPRLIPFLP